MTCHFFKFIGYSIDFKPIFVESNRVNCVFFSCYDWADVGLNVSIYYFFTHSKSSSDSEPFISQTNASNRIYNDRIRPTKFRFKCDSLFGIYWILQWFHRYSNTGNKVLRLTNKNTKIPKSISINNKILQEHKSCLFHHRHEKTLICNALPSMGNARTLFAFKWIDLKYTLQWSIFHVFVCVYACTEVS